jgi:hypothetical protein
MRLPLPSSNLDVDPLPDMSSRRWDLSAESIFNNGIALTSRSVEVRRRGTRPSDRLRAY